MAARLPLSTLVNAAKLTAWTAVALAWCAGFVDAACYQSLAHTYTSHITGNTASLSSHAVAAAWDDAGRFGLAIASFLAGLLLSAFLQQVEHREGIRSAFAAVLALEVLLLGGFIFLSARPAPLALLLVLPAMAMGMQTVTVTRVGRLRVYTTYMTGNLSKFAEAAVACLFAEPDRRESRRQAAVTFSLWFAFLAGCICGVAADNAYGSIALLAPMGILACCIPIDLRRPRALGDTADD